MATKNFVPRASGEGSLGTFTKPWGTGNFNILKINGINASILTASDAITAVTGQPLSLFINDEEYITLGDIPDVLVSSVVGRIGDITLSISDIVSLQNALDLKATIVYVDSAVAGATIVDASATVKGKLKLAGDLGGTADLPIVIGLSSKAESSTLTSHISNLSNPHSVTKNQIGLSNVLDIIQEPALGNPSVDGQVLTSTTLGVRLWANLPTEFSGSYTDLTNVPLTFPPSAHIHSISNVTNLQTILDEKALTTDLLIHIEDIENPHEVTKIQVGLSNLTNDSQVKRNEMGVASGVATLDGSGLIPNSQLPPIAITNTFVVINQTGMLALIAEVGDIAVRSDLNKTFILKTTDGSVLSHWQELLTPTDSVLSVNGYTGTVSLTKNDLNLSNVENTALSTWVGTSNITTLGTVSSGLWNGNAITDNYITSASIWNAKQNAITLGITAQYLRGDLSLATFPTTLSSFTNDSAFITSAGAPVQSVNTLTGQVSLSSTHLNDTTNLARLNETNDFTASQFVTLSSSDSVGVTITNSNAMGSAHILLANSGVGGQGFYIASAGANSNLVAARGKVYIYDNLANLPVLIADSSAALFNGSVSVGGFLSVADEAYGAGWNESTNVPTKNAVYDKIEAIAAGTTSRWLIKSAAYTAVTGDKLACDLSTTAFTITLPASPVTGDSVRVMDGQGQAATRNLTVARNGSLIAASATDLIVSTNNADAELIYVGGAMGWQITRYQ